MKKHTIVLENLLKNISEQRETVIYLQKGMTQLPAISPADGGIGEWDKAMWLKDVFLSWGITDIEHIDAPDPRTSVGKRPNMVIRIPGKSSRTLWIMGHMDVVPEGQASLWKTNPFELSIDSEDDDIIRGRGVEDNQQSIVAAMLIAKALKELNIEPDLSYAIMLVADEESHNVYGIRHIFEVQADIIKKDDLVLVPDFGTKEGNLLVVAEKSVLWAKVTIEGKQCHASTPEDGKNSLVAAADFITQVQAVEDGFTLRNELFSPSRSTMIPTKYEGNIDNVNTIPGMDVFYIDCRILPEYKVDDVLNAFKTLGEKIAEKHSLSVKVEALSVEESTGYTDPQSEVVIKLQKAIKNIYDIDGKAGGIGGNTVAQYVRKMGIPAVAWSRAFPNYHQPNEGSRISFALGDAQVFAQLLFEEDKERQSG